MYPQPYCIFQYLTISTSKEKMKKKIFLIGFYNNLCSGLKSISHYMSTSSCHWALKSSYQNILPQEVNDYYIQYIDNTGTCESSQIVEQSSLCICTTESHYDCHIDDLGYLYPGQTLTMSLHQYNQNIPVATAVINTEDISQKYLNPCVVLGINEYIQIIEKNCTKLHYTIGFPTENWCQLFIKVLPKINANNEPNIFHIKQLICPTGFVKIGKRCQCDPVLAQYGITNCNINDQTILRPANSWISATTHNNSYIYHISLHCPFHYCLYTSLITSQLLHS